MKKRQIQTLIFSKKFFDSKNDIRKYINFNGFKILKKKKKGIDENKNCFRVRQREPSRFKKKTFVTHNITKGVRAVKGFLK